MASHDASLDGKLAARFGGGALAKQAARQALVNRSKKQPAGPEHATECNGASSPWGHPGLTGIVAANTAPLVSTSAALTATPGIQFTDLRSRSPSPQCSSPSSTEQQQSKAAVPSELDEIMGVMEALGGPRRDSAACCLSVEQRYPDLHHSLGSVGHTIQEQSPVLQPAANAPVTSPATSGIRSSRSPVKQSAARHSGERSSQPLRLEPEQQHQGEGSKASGPMAHHTRASLLSSKVPPGKGPVITVKPALFSFDDAHPVLADKHYLHTKEQNRMLESDRANSPSADQNGSNGHSPTKRRAQTAQPSAPGSPSKADRRYASSSNPLPASTASGVRPMSALATGRKTSRSSTAAGVWSPTAASHASALAAAAVSEQHGTCLSEIETCTRAQRWAAAGTTGSTTGVAGPATEIAAAFKVEAAGSAISSNGGSIAARQELLSVMKNAQQAMAASAHLRTRQNTHLPAASSSLSSWSSSAAAAAAAVAADTLASRGVVVAGSRKGREDATSSERSAVRAGAAASSLDAAADKDRCIQELASKVNHLEESLALLLSGQTLPAETAAALTAALSGNAVLVPGQPQEAGATAGRAAELEDVISTINHEEVMKGLEQLRMTARQRQTQQEEQSSDDSRPQQQLDACGSDNSGTDSSDQHSEAGAGDNSDCEMHVACGAFDKNRYEEFNKQVDAAMERRAAEQDYDSDLEEEEKAAIRANGEAAEALLELQEAERKLEELNGQEAQLQAIWKEQDEWMNEYRQQQQHSESGSEVDDQKDSDHLQAAEQRDRWQQQQQERGLHARASGDAAASRGQQFAESAASAAAARGQAAAAAAAAAAVRPSASPPKRDERHSGGGPRRNQHQVLSREDEQLLSMPFIPRMVQSLPDCSAASGIVPSGNAYHHQQQQTLDNLTTHDLQEEQQHQSFDRPMSYDLQEQQQQQEDHGISGYTSDNGDAFYSKQQRSRELGVDHAYTASAAAGSYADRARLMRSRSASPFKTTIAKPFAFEAAAAAKPKSIAAVKLEQDLVLKAQEEAGHYRCRFVASPIPASTMELRYLNIIAEQAARRADSKTRYKELLAAQECPFSFYERQKEVAAARAARRAAAKDPNRFQRPFKAKPVPAHVHEQRYESAAIGMEAARLAAKVRAEMAREKAAAKLQEVYKRRQELAQAAYRERLAHSSVSSSPIKHRRAGHLSATKASPGNSHIDLSKSTSALHQQPCSGSQSQNACSPLDSERAGRGGRGQSAGSSPVRRPASASWQNKNAVPDFKALHAQWGARMAAIKAGNRRRVTVPEEFRLNGSTPQEQAERAKKQAERRERILASMQDDAYSLKELRWPYVSCRAPPVHLGHPARPKSADVGGTSAAQLRAETTRQAMAAGRFDTTEERERKQWELMKAEQQQRHAQWQDVQAKELRKRLEQHQQQLEHTRQQRLQQGLASSTSTTGGGSAVDQSRGASVAGADAATTAAGVGIADIDAAQAAAAGRAVATASAVQGGVVPSAAEVAAHLDQLLKGKADIKLAKLEQQQQRAADRIGFGTVARGSSSNSLCKSSTSPGWIRRMITTSKERNTDRLRHSRDASGTGGTGGRPGSGGSPVSRRVGLSGRVEAPLMHIEARHAQAEKAAREMVEDALLQQGIEAYRYVEG